MSHTGILLGLCDHAVLRNNLWLPHTSPLWPISWCLGVNTVSHSLTMISPVASLRPLHHTWVWTLSTAAKTLSQVKEQQSEHNPVDDEAAEKKTACGDGDANMQPAEAQSLTNGSKAEANKVCFWDLQRLFLSNDIIRSPGQHQSISACLVISSYWESMLPARMIVKEKTCPTLWWTHRYRVAAMVTEDSWA